jgi:hypothetical protein
MRKINENLSIGNSLTMTDIQLFAVKSIEESMDQDKSMFVGYDEEDEHFFFTDDIKEACTFDGVQLISDLDDFIYQLEKSFDHTYIVEYIGVEPIINYGTDS